MLVCTLYSNEVVTGKNPEDFVSAEVKESRADHEVLWWWWYRASFADDYLLLQCFDCSHVTALYPKIEYPTLCSFHMTQMVFCPRTEKCPRALRHFKIHCRQYL